MTATLDARAGVFAALGDAHRLRILVRLGDGPASATTLAQDAPITRQAVVKHLRVLQEAGLVGPRRAGREVVYDVRPEGLAAPAHWLDDVAAAWDRRLAALRDAAERP